NLIAGRKAKTAAAYGPAFNYLQVGSSLLGTDAWRRQYDLALALHVETAEAAYLNGDFARMEQLIDAVCQRAQTLLHTVKAYEVRLSAYSVQNRQREGIKTGLQVLELLGVPLSEKPSQAEIFQGLEETRHALAGKTIEDLLSLPAMTDPHKLAAVG